MKYDVYSDKMYAMSYEYLIRRASIYKEKKEGKFVNSIKSESDLLTDYKTSLYEVTDYIKGAIQKALSDYRTIFSTEQTKELEVCKALLNDSSIEKVVEVIERAEKVMVDSRIFPS